MHYKKMLALTTSSVELVAADFAQDCKKNPRTYNGTGILRRKENDKRVLGSRKQLMFVATSFVRVHSYKPAFNKKCSTEKKNFRVPLNG